MWRRRNSTTQEYSWEPRGKTSRIDYWLVSSSLDSQIDEIVYDNSAPFSHHKGILLKFRTAEVKHGKRLWKMNASVSKTPLFQEAFKHMWKKWKYKIQEFGDIRIWWDLVKKQIKDVAIWCAIQLANERKFQRTASENRVKYLKHRDIWSNEINQWEQKLKDIYIQQSEGAKIRSVVCW